MKDYCECCSNIENLTEQDAERRDRSVFKITICNKCLNDYNLRRF